MKRTLILILILLLMLAGCSPQETTGDIAATTLPVWEFTTSLCDGTGLTVTRLVTQNVSCLHDYSLNVDQVKAIEGAKAIVISGAGLEDFLSDSFRSSNVIDAAAGIELLCGSETGHDHDHDHSHNHSHEQDPHIWLSPELAMSMSRNICEGLCNRFPEHADTFRRNLVTLTERLEALDQYGQETLGGLSCRKLITFHDGFSYFAEHYGLTILEAVEEESGSEASAQELKHLIGMVNEHQLPAVFIEVNGSVSAAEVIARETGAAVFTLDMAMGGNSYFEAMYRNIDTIKEALE